MARFDILSSGGVVRYTGAPTYNGAFGRASYLEFTEIASPTPIDWAVGDYIDYPRTGLRYKLYSIPQPERHARSGAVGNSIVYRNVQLFAATKDLEICPFNDLVMGDNLIHYSSQPDVNTYENVRGIADRIQANLDAFYGSGVWSIVLYDGDPDVSAIMSEAKEFSVSDGNCMTALDAIYSTWKGIGWIHTYENGVNVITIGRPNVQNGDNSTDLFTYGLGNGLKVLATALSGQNELATRIYPFGSTRNMISRYYNGKTNIKDHESVYIPNLMLPVTLWGQTDGLYDPRKAFLENAEATAKYGLRARRVYFDGNGEYEDIYPSIGGVTAKNVRDAKSAAGDSTYVPSTSIYPDAERMDTLKGATNPADNGIMGTEGQKYVETITGTYSSNASATDIITRMGVAYRRSGVFGVASITGGGKVTIRSGYVRNIIIPRYSDQYVKYHVGVYLDGSLVKEMDYDPDVYGDGNDLYYLFAFQDITFNLTAPSGGELSVVVTAEVSAAISTQFTDSQNAANVTYEFQKNFADTFTVTLKQIGFDISKQQSSISDGLCTLNMKSGMCAGRDFVIKSVTYNSTSDSWTAVCYRQEDSSLGQYFPNTIYPVLAGDQFVLTDLEMPELYIGLAAARLYDAATALLAKLSAPKIIYEPEIDAKVIAEYGDVLKEGMYMAVGDSELIGDAPVYVLIDTLTIYENEANIPTYKVTLRDERYENTISKLTGEISRLNAARRASLYDEARSRYLNDTEGESVGEPGVRVEYDTNTFSYVDASTVSPASIAMLAVAVNIPSPLYQWQYHNGTSWVNITSATSDHLTVSPDNQQYFPAGALVANIRCRVQNGSDYVYSDAVAVSKIMGGQGTSTITMMLFRRDDPAPDESDKPIGNITYDFATDTLSGTVAAFNGWSREFPTGDAPCYVIFATKTSSSGVAVFEPGDWGDVRPYVANGTDGEPGAPGTPGTPGAPGTPGQDACVLQLDPPALQIPTDASLEIPAGTPLPTSKATLYKGNAAATGVTYSLASDQAIFIDGDMFVLNGAITPETIGGVVYVWEYVNEQGDTILLSDNEDVVWDGDEAREDFYPATEDDGLVIDSVTGQINVTGDFSFLMGAAVRRVRVYALYSTPTQFQTTLTISAQKQGNQGDPGTPGTPGSNGYTTDRVAIYQRSAYGAPQRPTTNAGYNVTNGTIVSGSIGNWSLVVPSGTTPCYVSYNYVSSRSGASVLTLNSDNWTPPVLLVENGVSPYTVVAKTPYISVPCTSSGDIITPTPAVSCQCQVYRGATPVSASYWVLRDSVIVVNGERYFFINYDPEMPESPYVWEGEESTTNIYTQDRYPLVGDPYLDEGERMHEITDTTTYVKGLSINDSGLITGTPTYIMGSGVSVEVAAYAGGGYRTTAISVTKNKIGERGLAGKVMRGVSTFSATPGAAYQGLEDTDPTHIYYDVVTYNDNLYLCLKDQKNGTPAAQITPGTDATVWAVATNFKFVATDLLLAQNAYVKFLESRGIYLENGANNIVGGGQGGNGVIWWAGTSGASPDPSTAPYRVNYDGSVVASEGTIGPYTLDDDGLTRTGKPSGSATLSAVYAMRRILLSQTQQGATSSFEVAIGNAAFATIAEKIFGRIVLSLESSNAQTGVALRAIGDIRRYGLAKGEYESAVTVLECTQAEYNAAVNDGNATNKTIFVITDSTPKKVYLGTIQLV